MIDSCFMEAAARSAGLEEPSVVLQPLAGTPGPGAALEPRRPLYPASMIKVPIAAALALAVADGRRRLSDPVRVARANETPNDAVSPFVAGFESTLAATAAAMLSASDNVATNVLIDELTRGWINDVGRSRLGLGETAVHRKLSGALPLIDDPDATGRNAHPAADAARLLTAIALERKGRFSFVYDALAAQVWNGKIPAGLRPTDTFVHKTGDTDEVSHDGGILTLADGRRYVFVVYTALPSSPDADGRIAAFASAIRAALDEPGPRTPATALANP